MLIGLSYLRLIFGACFKITEWAEDNPTVAFDDDAIGVVIGKLKDGVAAYRTLYVSNDGALTHGPLCVGSASGSGQDSAFAANQK